MATLFDYAHSKEVADRMIARFGMPAVLRVPTASGPAYNPTPGSPTDYPCQVVVIFFTTREILDSPGRILSQDKKVIMAKGDLPLSPSPAHKLLIGGEVHRIIGPDAGMGVQTLAPGGVTVLYELQCRK